MRLIYAVGPSFQDGHDDVPAGLGTLCSAVRSAARLLANEQVRTLIVSTRCGESPRSDCAPELVMRLITLAQITRCLSSVKEAAVVFASDEAADAFSAACAELAKFAPDRPRRSVSPERGPRHRFEDERGV